MAQYEMKDGKRVLVSRTKPNPKPKRTGETGAKPSAKPSAARAGAQTKTASKPEGGGKKSPTPPASDSSKEE